MGGKESKQFPLSYEDALKRVTESEKRRLSDAFRLCASANGMISKSVFFEVVLENIIPTSLANRLFSLAGNSFIFGESLNGNNSRAGLYFKELFTFLVLITRGTFEEKGKFIFGLYSGNVGSHIEFGEMIRLTSEWENGVDISQPVYSLFYEADKVSFEGFMSWLENNRNVLGVSKWLLHPNENLSLVNQLDTPTFHQTLAGVTHLEVGEIVELEKRFWTLANGSSSGQIDLSVISSLVCPPFPHSLVPAFFSALDENRDGHIDFKELSCGVSAACRGPDLERQKFVFKMFDFDHDGILNKIEVCNMIKCMSEIKLSSRIPEELTIPSEGLTLEEFLVWTLNNNNLYSNEFSKLLYELCNISLGLKPLTRSEESEIILGWIQRELRSPLVPGSLWYVVSYDWWSDWNAYVDHPMYTPYSNSKTSVVPSNASNSVVMTAYTHLLTNNETGSPKKKCSSLSVPRRPGPIDNSSLILSQSRNNSLTEEGGKLKSKILRGTDFELLPERVWKALVLWYGEPVVTLPRQVIRTSSDESEFELYPLSLKIFRHQFLPRTPHVPPMGYSTAAAIQGGPSTTRRYQAHNATFSRRTTLIQILNFLSGKLGFKSEDVRLWHYKDDSSMKLLEDDSYTLEEYSFKDEDGLLLEVRSRDGTWPEEISSLISDRRLSLANYTGIKGVTGLSNLGNTCYMNAAIQSVAHTRILSEYFNSGCHLFELNRFNSLGMKGHIAKRFGDLVRDMMSGDLRSVAPIKLRWTIARYQPHFNGCQQQDSQELLAFLLDGLHEDLNRVTDKSYMELKDSDGRPDDEVASEAWESHTLRHKSIIVDLFHGQLKSKVTCKVCGHESVRFDPFTYLSLPLPMESFLHLEVIVIKQNGSIPLKVGLTLDVDATSSNVKESLSQLCHISQDNLLLANVTHAQLQIISSENQKFKNYNGTCIYAYELRGASKESVEKTNMIVGFHRKMMMQETYFLSIQKYEPTLFGLPLVLNVDVKTTYQDLYQGVWKQISRLVSALPPRDTSHNHATDCDDSLGYNYPFILKATQKCGMWCSQCSWTQFCRGCSLSCTTTLVDESISYLTIDWDTTALHLRYLHAQEKAFVNDPSVHESYKAATDPITLEKCLQAFTREEQLGPDEKYYCSVCKQHQLAIKKLQIWKLPPILIVHWKRFHYLNGRWIKSHKIVDFPFSAFKPGKYLAAIPSITLKRYEELKENGEKIEKEEDEKKKSRLRQESTSLESYFIADDNLIDFHQHRLNEGTHPLDIQYNLYAMVCHSGVLGSGHYTSYGKNKNGKWYFFNDSASKEIPESQIDKTTAYMLFYERENLSLSQYLPQVPNGSLPNVQDIEDELDSDFKKQCALM